MRTALTEEHSPDRRALRCNPRSSSTLRRLIAGALPAAFLVATVLPAGASSDPASHLLTLPTRTTPSAGTDELYLRPLQPRLAEPKLGKKRKKSGTKLRYTKPLNFAGNDMLLKVRLPGKRKSILSVELKF